MKYILILLFTLFATPAFAQQASTTDQLYAEIAKMDDAQREEALRNLTGNSAPTKSASLAREWVDIGNGLGEGIAATAERLGVVANDFARSPVGKLAMVLIVWSVMGDTISGWISASLFWMFVIPLWMYNFRKMFGVYNEKGKFIKYDLDMFRDRSTHGAIAWCYILSLGILVIAGFILM